MINIAGKQFFQAQEHDRPGKHLFAMDTVAEFYRIKDSFYARIVIVTGTHVQITDDELISILREQF